MTAALSAWKGTLPDDPGAWLYRVAFNNLMGSLRKSGGQKRILDREGEAVVTAHGAMATAPDATDSPLFAGEIADELLRMLFIACDEDIPPESRLVFALKVLCGFSTTEIAFRLFMTEANVHKRYARARDRLRSLPPGSDPFPLPALRARLPSVRMVLYLLFNEGYLSAQPDRAIRGELCDEAIRLTTMLAGHPLGADPETYALLALMHLHGARVAARLDGVGGLQLLEDQDRKMWNPKSIQVGLEWLQKSGSGTEYTRYHAEAAIAAEHCLAPSFAETRWKEIADAYAMLDRISPSPLHALNRAVAMAEWKGPEAGLALLLGLEPPPWMARFHLWDAVLGELHRRAGAIGDARYHLERALASAPTEAERKLLKRRLESMADNGMDDQ